MGCHTWCAYKVHRTIEEARKIWIDEQEKTIERWKEISDNPYDDCRIAYEWTQEDVDFGLAVFKRQLRMVKNGLCNIAVMRNQPELSYYRESRGFFIDCKDYHDIFRIGNYPTDELFSKDDCMKFIERNKNKIQFTEKSYERIDEFWNKYPDGFMHFV